MSGTNGNRPDLFESLLDRLEPLTLEELNQQRETIAAESGITHPEALDTVYREAQKRRAARRGLVGPSAEELDLEAEKNRAEVEAIAEQARREREERQARDDREAVKWSLVKELEGLDELSYRTRKREIAKQYNMSARDMDIAWNDVRRSKTKPASVSVGLVDHAKGPKLPKVLGYSGDRYFIRSDRTGSVASFSATALAQRPNLYALAEPDVWLHHFPSDREGKISTDNAVNWIIARARNPFDPATIRGRGAWFEGGRPIYNDGESIHFGRGESVPIDSADLKAYYERRPIICVGDRPATVEENHEALGVLARAAWTSNAAAGLLMGWCTSATVGGALSWRSHLGIYAPSGTGKTDIIRGPVASMTGVVPKLGDSTPAGIRQDLQSDSIPVAIDEREADTVDRQDSDDELRLMMRQSSSGDAHIVKGTQGGHAITFLLQSAFLIAGTTKTAHFRADQSRQTSLSLKRDPNRDWAKWEADLDRCFTLEYGARFRRRIIDRLPEIVQSRRLFTVASAHILGDARSGDQLGTIILGAWFAFRDEEPTEETVRLYCEQIISDYRSSGDLADETSEYDEVLRAILQSLVYSGGGERKSLAELLLTYHVAPGDEDARKQLWRHGIRLEMGRDGYEVLFARNHTILTQLAGRFGRAYAQRLSDILGSHAVDPMKFGDEDGKPHVARAIAVPFDIVENAINV